MYYGKYCCLAFSQCALFSSQCNPVKDIAGGCVQTLEEYCGKYKEEGEEFKTLINGVLPDGWDDELPTFTPEDKPLATRLHSQTMLNALAPTLPGFWGGSAGKLPVCLGFPCCLFAISMLSPGFVHWFTLKTCCTATAQFMMSTN